MQGRSSMSIRLVLGLTCLVVLSQISQSQSAEQDDIEASTKSCRLVQMTLAARERHRAKGDVSVNDDFTAAAKACKSPGESISRGRFSRNPESEPGPALNLRAARSFPFDATGTICCSRKKSRRLEGPRPVLRAQPSCQESLQCRRDRQSRSLRETTAQPGSAVSQ